ncbi:MAG: nucleotidyltransferase substrate binding protein [Chloroflexota bacterium]
MKRRWHARFLSYQKALTKLREITDVFQLEELNEFERDSLVKRFELTFELAWNVLKDFLEDQGAVDLFGSRNTFRSAFAVGVIKDGDLWMDMIDSRIKSTHIYDEEKIEEIAKLIYNPYARLFIELETTLLGQLGE